MSDHDTDNSQVSPADKLVDMAEKPHHNASRGLSSPTPTAFGYAGASHSGTAISAATYPFPLVQRKTQPMIMSPPQAPPRSAPADVGLYSGADRVGDPDQYVAVDVGAVPGQSFIDHRKYAALGRKIDADGWSPLINTAFEDEYETRSPKIREIGLATFQKTADDLCCAMDPEVLKQICFGNLAQAYDESVAQGGELHNGLDKIANRGDDHPSIYLRIFCPKQTGQPLELVQANLIASHARAYANRETAHNQCSHQIDVALV